MSGIFTFIDIERVKKSACYVILGSKYTTHQKALDRREKLCKTFAIKASQSEQNLKWFYLNPLENKGRRKRTKYKEIRCRTKRFENSPIPYMTKLLNKMN